MRLSAAPRWSGGHHPVGDAKSSPIRLSFNPQLRVEFRGATVTSDAGLLLPRELDERLGLDALIERHFTDPRTGHLRRAAGKERRAHPHAPLVRDRRPHGGAELPRTCPPQNRPDSTPFRAIHETAGETPHRP